MDGAGRLILHRHCHRLPDSTSGWERIQAAQKIHAGRGLVLVLRKNVLFSPFLTPAVAP